MEHKCEEIIKKVMLFLDGELSPNEHDWLREQLIQCPACLEHYEMEKDFKDFLCAKLKCMPACECDEHELKDKILSKIKGL
jgi:anti-sigma factor (TIGR02949 family)